MYEKRGLYSFSSEKPTTLDHLQQFLPKKDCAYKGLEQMPCANTHEALLALMKAIHGFQWFAQGVCSNPLLMELWRAAEIAGSPD